MREIDSAAVLVAAFANGPTAAEVIEMNLFQRRRPRVVENLPSQSAISGAQDDRLSSIKIRQRISATGPAVFPVQEKDTGQLASEFRIAGLVSLTRSNYLPVADTTQFFR